ncbi:ribonuclease H-like domain-containing protein [Tanacetum coccineum]
MSTIKLPTLKKGEYDIWAMKIEHYLAHTDYPIWKSFRKVMAQFCGNDESKKMQKNFLKQQFEGFSISNLEGLHKGYDRFQSLLNVSTAYGASSSSGHNSQRENSSSYTNDLMYSFFTNQSSGLQLDHEDLEQIDEFDLEEIDLKWKVAMISMGLKKFYKKIGRKLHFNAKEPVGFDKTKVECCNCTDWSEHADDEQENFALMAYNNSSSDIEENQLWYEEKIRFMKIDLDDKTDVFTYHKKLLAEAVKEKEDLKAKLKQWKSSSKNLVKLLGSKMSANDKFRLGYGDHKFDGNLSYEKEVFQSVFNSIESDVENRPLHDRFVKADEIHDVPPPMIYTPIRTDEEVDDSKFTYGKKKSKTIETCESNSKTSEYASCDSEFSNTPKVVNEPMTKQVINKPKVVCKPKVWTDAPIIEEYESESDNDYVPKDDPHKALKNKGMVLVTKPYNKTPYELITGKQPIISYIRPFGCHVTNLNTIDHLGKFEEKADEGFLVGYSLNSKAFRVYNLETKRVKENMHINFLENKPNVARKGPTWLFDLDYLTDSMNYQPITAKNKANKTVGPIEANDIACTQDDTNAGNSKVEAEPVEEHFILPFWPSYSSTIKSSEIKK